MIRKILTKLLFLFFVILTLNLSGCKKENAENIEILAAGASFPYPLYQKMFEKYEEETGVIINYQAIGSGGGIKQLTEKTTDFGGTDAFIIDEKISTAGGKILHIPTCLGAVVITYNLNITDQLNFTAELISDIFLGNITNWNDKKIATENPGVILPDLKIAVVHRSDSSGTTFIFSDYLAKVNKQWAVQVGRGKSLNWATGLGAAKNAGVAGQVKQIKGAIGYIEIAYAKQNDLKYGKVKNRSGNFISPDLKSVSLAAGGNIPPDTRVTITDTDAAGGYPIASFTWIILYKEQKYMGKTEVKAKAVVDALWWVIHNGQQYNETLDYGKLPPGVIKKAEIILKSVTYDNKKLLR